MENEKKLKIAVASSGSDATEHFGHCELFLIFSICDKKIVSREAIPNPGHKPGFLPNYLADQGVNVIMSGGMGSSAIDLFNQHDIEVVTGVSGDAESAVNAYLAGDLKSTGSICHEHAFESECGGHQNRK